MANTYTKIYIHLVFAVKYRKAQIPLTRADELYRYMSGIINNHKKCKSIKIGGTCDHVHILMRMGANINLSELVKNVKVSATKFLNEKNIVPGFAWQEGYGAFSISTTQTDAIENYIMHQVEHHYGVSFIDEYRNILMKNKIEFDEEYIFNDLE